MRLICINTHECGNMLRVRKWARVKLVKGIKMIVIVPRSGFDIHEKAWTGKIGVFF